MQRYAEYAPTEFDTRGLNLEERQDWLVVPVGRNRDSTALDRSNFRAALTALGGVSDTVEVHRFGHWACGWLELILVCPGSPAEQRALVIEASLAAYPVLDEADYSREEDEEAASIWKTASVADRLCYIKRCGADPKVSPFAARRDELPPGIYASDLVRS